MRKLSALTALLASAAAVAPGAAQSGDFTPYKGPHACKLLTPALASSVIGKGPRLTINKTPSKFVTHCQYSTKPAFVDVKAGTWHWINPFAGSDQQRVKGLGDEAWISPQGLYVRKGDNGISVNVAIVGTYAGVAADKVQAKEYALEKALAPKLLAGL